MDDIGEGIGGQGLGGTIGRAGGRMGEQNVDKRDKWGWAARNSSAMGMSSSRVSDVSSRQSRLLVNCWMVETSSLSERNESGDDCPEVLGRDSGCEVSCQVGLCEVEMLAVPGSMMPSGKLDLLLCLALGKGQV